MPKFLALSAFWKVDDRVGRRDDDALDGLVEVLVEDARGDDAAAAAEHLPSAVDVLDQGSLQVGVALHGTVANDVGELELGQLPELRTIDRRAVAEADVGVGGGAQHEVHGREEVRVVVLRLHLAWKRPNGSCVMTV